MSGYLTGLSEFKSVLQIGQKIRNNLDSAIYWSDSAGMEEDNLSMVVTFLFLLLRLTFHSPMSIPGIRYFY
jgi:hypothetical protein